MRKRTSMMIGGGAVLLILGSFLDLGIGFPGGDSDGESDGDSAKDADALVAVDADTSPLDNVINEMVETVVEPPEPMLPPVVDVLIDDDRYLVVVDAAQPDQRSAKTLPEIIAMAALVDGEDNGIRVRITRTPSAIAIAEAGLMKSLRSAGVDEDEIDSRRQLVQ
ncbi:MAG: hypothetical protein AAGJ40_17960 [Planctomycetota bacterium]